MTKDGSAEATIRDIKGKTRRTYSAEEKIRIVVEGLRGEQTIAELCRREGIAESLYYSWSKEFMEAGKARLAGDTKRQASSNEVDGLRQENEQLKQAVAELLLQNRVLKKVYLARRAGGTADALHAGGEAGNHSPRGGI
jgi:transposase